MLENLLDDVRLKILFDIKRFLVLIIYVTENASLKHERRPKLFFEIFSFYFAHENRCGKFMFTDIQAVGDDLLLLGDTNSTSTTASCLCVLTTDTETPVMTHATVSADLLESLQIFTQLRVDQR